MLKLKECLMLLFKGLLLIATLRGSECIEQFPGDKQGFNVSSDGRYI